MRALSGSLPINAKQLSGCSDTYSHRMQAKGRGLWWLYRERMVQGDFNRSYLKKLSLFQAMQAYLSRHITCGWRVGHQSRTPTLYGWPELYLHPSSQSLHPGSCRSPMALILQQQPGAVGATAGTGRSCCGYSSSINCGLFLSLQHR